MENLITKLTEFHIFGNSLEAYLGSVLVFIITYYTLIYSRMLIVKFLAKWAKRTDTKLDDIFVSVIGEIRNSFFVSLAILHAMSYLTISPALAKILHFILNGVILVNVLIAAGKILSFILGYVVFGSKKLDPVRASAIKNIETLLKVALWGAGLLFFLDNLGFNVSSIVAGLGIGGIAVALAAQNLLGDAFSSFTIFLDRPFEVGDSIEVDGLRGSVEHVGMKTTRVRSVNGELLVFSNSDLTKSRIQNYQKMQSRRATFKIGVTYNTSHDRLRYIPQLLKQIIETQPNVVFDRAHFNSLGEYALIFDAVYFVTDPDYKIYMNIQQNINYMIMDEFSSLNIEFAFPTQTVLQPTPQVHG